MSYESYTLGTIYIGQGKANKSPEEPREPNRSQRGANNRQLGDPSPLLGGQHTALR